MNERAETVIFHVRKEKISHYFYYCVIKPEAPHHHDEGAAAECASSLWTRYSVEKLIYSD